MCNGPFSQTTLLNGFLWTSGWRPNALSPPTSGASWEQFLGESSIWFPRKMFYRIFYKSKVTLRVDIESLDRFLVPHTHQGLAGSRTWGTAPSGLPGSLFAEKFIDTKLLLWLIVTNLVGLWRSINLRGKLGAIPWGQKHLVSQEDFLRKVFKQSFSYSQ